MNQTERDFLDVTKEAMKENSVGVDDVAARIGVNVKYIKGVLDGEKALSPPIAFSLLAVITDTDFQVGPYIGFLVRTHAAAEATP